MRKLLKNPQISITGGFLIDTEKEEEVLKYISNAIKGAGFDGKVGIILDFSAGDYYDRPDGKGFQDISKPIE